MKTMSALRFAAALACCQAIELAVPGAREAFAATALPRCTMTVLKAGVAGDSPGMGKEGIDLTLTNHGKARCELGSVAIAFMNAGSLVTPRSEVAAFLRLAPGDAATTQIVWSDGIGGNGPCADATLIAVGTWPAVPARALPVRAHICALHTPKPSFTALPFSLAKR